MTARLDRVSYHAVSRYCERILGVTIEDAGQPPRAVAEAYATAAGMSLDEVRRRIWTPGVALAVDFGVRTVSNGSFAVAISQPAGVIATVLLPFTHDQHRLRVLTQRELRRKAQRTERRMKRRPSPIDAKPHDGPTEED